MGTPKRRGAPGAEITTSLHESALLDEALEETFPASDPVAINVDRAPECTPDTCAPKPASQARRVREKELD